MRIASSNLIHYIWFILTAVLLVGFQNCSPVAVTDAAGSPNLVQGPNSALGAGTPGAGAGTTSTPGSGGTNSGGTTGGTTGGTSGTGGTTVTTTTSGGTGVCVLTCKHHDDDDYHPNYRRRPPEMGFRDVSEQGVVDNSYVVAYNPYLLKKYK